MKPTDNQNQQPGEAPENNVSENEAGKVIPLSGNTPETASPETQPAGEAELIQVPKGKLDKLLSQNQNLKTDNLQILFDIKQVLEALTTIGNSMNGKDLSSLITKVMKGEDLFKDEMPILTAFAEKYQFVFQIPALNQNGKKPD